MSVKQSLCHAVLRIVLENVQRDGYGTDVQDDVSHHFASLPSRYALSVNPQRHEDVLLHMHLINEAREENQSDPDHGPVVRVRRVCLGKARSSASGIDGPPSPRRRHSTDLSSNSPSARSLEGFGKGGTPGVGAGGGATPHGGPSGPGIPVGVVVSSTNYNNQSGARVVARRTIACAGSLAKSVPIPTFGSSAPNSSHLWGSTNDLTQPVPTAAGRKSGSLSRNSHGSSAGEGRGGGFSLAATLREGAPSSGAGSGGLEGCGGGGRRSGLNHSSGLLVGSRGSAASSLEGTSVDEEEGRSAGSSWHRLGGGAVDEAGFAYGWEISIAAPDRPGLLTWFTTALANSDLELNINEAHVFSTSDGMALQDFMVTSATHHQHFYANECELQDALEHVLRRKWRDKGSRRATEQMQLANLKAVVEAMAYEDWAVDFTDLSIGQRLGGGASGRLCRGTYRGQDVAVKVMQLAAPDELAACCSSSSSGDLGMGGRGGSGGVCDAGLSVSTRSASALELLQCFKQEVAIMRMVRHKNVVQFIGACSHWPRLFIVTELMARGSVRDVLDQRGCGLPLPVALKILRDAARGLDFLHRRGIVHRDLKAANLLVDENDVVKLCDFGVARLLPSKQSQQQQLVGESTAKTRPDMTAETGTYRWMAPEVMEHQPYDHRADIFSFGVTIWEVITGDLPYSGLTPLQAAIGVLQRNLRPTLPPNLPSRVSSLLTRCWAADPNARPDFTEILSVLDCSLKGISPSSLVIGSAIGTSDGGPSSSSSSGKAPLGMLIRKSIFGGGSKKY